MNLLAAPLSGRRPTRFALVINKPSRELCIMEKIREELLKSSISNQVEIFYFSENNFFKKLLKSKPHVVMTFPFTSVGLSKYFYALKIFFMTKVVLFRTEGALNYKSEDWASKYWIRCSVGYDKYNWKLVDKEIFWGEKQASVVGQELLNQKKIFSLDDILVIGNPRYEDIVNKRELPICLKDEKTTKMLSFSRDKRVLILSGFHMADYTIQDYYLAGDLDVENNINNLLEFSIASKQLRKAYIDMAKSLAEKYSDMLFFFKKHPIEKPEVYSDAFLGISNIIFVDEDIDSQSFISNVGLLIQYGSTVLMESYLAQIPSIYAYLPGTKEYYTSLGWPSTVECEVTETVLQVENYRNKKLIYHATPDSIEVLKTNFNIQPGSDYRPSKLIAAELLKPARKMSRLQIIFDPFGFYNSLKILKMFLIKLVQGDLKN